MLGFAAGSLSLVQPNNLAGVFSCEHSLSGNSHATGLAVWTFDAFPNLVAGLDFNRLSTGATATFVEDCFHLTRPIAR